MQVTSDEQEENIISAKMEEDCLWNSILSKCEEIDSFQLQNISGICKIKYPLIISKNYLHLIYYIYVLYIM